MMKQYERTAIQLLKGQPKPKRFAQLVNGRFLSGTASLHRTPQSRRWRTFWRLKSRRSCNFSDVFNNEE